MENREKFRNRFKIAFLSLALFGMKIYSFILQNCSISFLITICQINVIILIGINVKSSRKLMFNYCEISLLKFSFNRWNIVIFSNWVIVWIAVILSVDYEKITPPIRKIEFRYSFISARYFIIRCEGCCEILNFIELIKF